MKNIPPMTRVLIVEPDEGLRILLTEELLEEGHDVIATRPENLWKRLEAERPDLVLMGFGDRDRLRQEGLRTEELPALIYGRGSIDLSVSEEVKGIHAVTAVLDLKEIKAKVRKHFEEWGTSGPPPTGTSNHPYRTLPQIQMQFDFGGGNGR